MPLSASKKSLIAGFTISFIAILFNFFVIAKVNTQLAALSSEHSKTTESLREQNANMTEAETKLNRYTQMYYLSQIVPEKTREDARGEAGIILEEALTYLYASANSVSIHDIRRVESEQLVSAELESAYNQLKQEIEEKPKTAPPKPQEEKPSEDQTEEALVEAAIKELETKGDPQKAKENIAGKMAAISVISSAAAASENEKEFLVRIYPSVKLMIGQWLDSAKAKENRLREIEAERTRWQNTQTWCTFAALSLQILGLMFVFMKDFFK